MVWTTYTTGELWTYASVTNEKRNAFGQRPNSKSSHTPKRQTLLTKLQMACAKPYMITTNIDIKDGLNVVNSAVGILRLIQ